MKNIKYKLFSIDLDGTILSRIFKKTSKKNCLAIQNFMNCGGIAILNSGRAPWMMEKIIKKINSYGNNKIKYISCWNGAFIQDLSTNLSSSSFLDSQYAWKILNILQQSKKTIAWFYLAKNPSLKYIKIYPKFSITRLIKSLGNFSSIKENDNLSSMKILIYGNKNTIATIYDKITNADFSKFINVIKSSAKVIEIMPLGIDKGYAIRQITLKHNIPIKNVVAIGDSFNDLAAFKNSGFSICVKHRKNNKLSQHASITIKYKKNILDYVLNHFIFQDINHEE